MATEETGRFSEKAEAWIDNLNRVIDELATERDCYREALIVAGEQIMASLVVAGGSVGSEPEETK